MGEVATIGVHNDLTAGQASVTVGAADYEITCGIDMDVGNVRNIETVVLQNRSNDTLPDVLTQLFHLEIRTVHDGDNHSIHTNHIALFVIFHGNLGLAVRAQQIGGMDTLGQTVAQSPGQGYRQGHQLGSLGAGTTEHHTLVAGTAYFIISTQRDICRLGMDTALDLHRIRIEAVAGIDITDLTNSLTGNFLVIYHSFGGNLTADDAEVGGHHGFTSNTGCRILSQASIQDGIRNRVSNLIGVAVGYTFGSK